MILKYPLLVLLTAILLFSSNRIYADNWHASISSTLQSDNRFSPDNKFSADALLNYAYDDSDNDLHGRLNLLLGESEYSFQQGNILYELSIEKGWSELNTRIKAGRFERSDNLGFYFLDGINLTYHNTADDFGFEFYLGKPGRIEEVQSIEGDYLYGMELFSHQTNRWNSELLDSWDIRFGLQKIKNIEVAHTINLAVNTQGEKQEPKEGSHCRFDCQRLKGQFLLTYHIEKSNIEDLFFDLRIPVHQDLRLRLAYEYYHPELDLNPGFREKFYSYYAFGNQKLSRINVDYFFNHQVSGFIEWLYSQRETGDDGSGYGVGVKIKKPFSDKLDLDVSLSIDSIESGKNKVDSLYVNLEHHLSSRMNLQLEGIYREEIKYGLGNNQVSGLNAQVNYMLKNNLIFSFEGRVINNTRLRNEHLARLNVTYYFDNL